MRDNRKMLNGYEFHNFIMGKELSDIKEKKKKKMKEGGNKISWLQGLKNKFF